LLSHNHVLKVSKSFHIYKPLGKFILLFSDTLWGNSRVYSVPQKVNPREKNQARGEKGLGPPVQKKLQDDLQETSPPTFVESLPPAPVPFVHHSRLRTHPTQPPPQSTTLHPQRLRSPHSDGLRNILTFLCGW
jgi:hypothetical protein